MSVVAYVWCIAVANVWLGFYWGVRHRGHTAAAFTHSVLDAMDRLKETGSRGVMSAAPRRTSQEVSQLGRQDEPDADEAGQENVESNEPDSTVPTAPQADTSTARTAKPVWQEVAKSFDDELSRIERHVPMLRGGADRRTLQHVVDELTRVIRRELSAWNQAWEELTQVNESPTPEQNLLEQAISQAETTLTNLGRLARDEDVDTAVQDLEKELIKLRRFQITPKGEGNGASRS